jgi:RNA polymerase sigma-70 factor (ECF subfamily)
MSPPPINLAALYADEQSRLRRHLVRRGLSAAAAADVVQDAFVKLLRAPRDEIRDIRAYLQRAAETLAIDAWRRQSRSTLVIAPLELADDAIADPGPSADMAMMAREDIDALAAAIDALSPRCREVLLLHRFDGLSYAEIAARLGISRNTVMVHLANAMTALRRRLRENAAATG